MARHTRRAGYYTPPVPFDFTPPENYLGNRDVDESGGIVSAVIATSAVPRISGRARAGSGGYRERRRVVAFNIATRQRNRGRCVQNDDEKIVSGICHKFGLWTNWTNWTNFVHKLCPQTRLVKPNFFGFVDKLDKVFPLNILENFFSHTHTYWTSFIDTVQGV